MNKEQIAKLKELAQAATPGPWSTGTTSRQKIHEKLPPMYEAAVHVGDDSNRGNCLATIFLGGRGALHSDLQSVSDNAAYIAAANPAAILELIDLAERALLAATPPALAGSQVQAVGDARKRVARAIWNLRREDDDRCDMELEDMGDQHSVWAEADAAIAAMREQQT